MSTKQVLKFPDGEGGYIYKYKDSDGVWKECDADGSIPVSNEGGKAGKTHSGQKASRADSPRGHGRIIERTSSSEGRFIVNCSADEADIIRKYRLWSEIISGQKRTYKDMFLDVLLERIRKDRGFEEFLKNCRQ